MIRKTYDLSKMGRATRPLVARLLNNVADLLQEDMKRGVARQVDVDNRPFVPLKSRTIKAKQRKGSLFPSRALVDTNTMVGGIYSSKRATAQKLHAQIMVPKGRGGVRKGNRQEIGSYHMEGSGNLPRRRFWYVPGVDKMPRVRRLIEKLRKDTQIKIVRAAHKGA